MKERRERERERDRERRTGIDNYVWEIDSIHVYGLQVRAYTVCTR